MGWPKVHLAHPEWGTACNSGVDLQTTTDPAQVTCLYCQRGEVQGTPLSRKERELQQHRADIREPEEAANWIAITLGGRRHRKLAARLVLYAKAEGIRYDEALRRAVQDFLKRKGL